MLWARGAMDDWVGEDGGDPHIKTLTAYFLALYAIMATQVRKGCRPSPQFHCRHLTSSLDMCLHFCLLTMTLSVKLVPNKSIDPVICHTVVYNRFAKRPPPLCC